MYARVATFDGDVGETVDRIREDIESGEVPAGLEGAKLLMLVDRASGKMISVTLFETEDAMRRGDETLNAMSPTGDATRSSVEFYEAPVAKLD
jgi:hypothetical protein